MKTSWRQILIKSFFPVFAAVMLVAGLAYAVWTEPTVAPPGGNAEAPINVSSVSQYKSGALGIGGLLAAFGGFQMPTGAGAGKVLTSDAAGFGSWQAGGGGGVSYTYYCFNESGGYLGTPVCPSSITIGTQGPCDAGFTVTKSLGSWGYCAYGPYSVQNWWYPPGGTCGTGACSGSGCGADSPKIGQAYVCSTWSGVGGALPGTLGGVCKPDGTPIAPAASCYLTGYFDNRPGWYGWMVYSYEITSCTPGWDYITVYRNGTGYGTGYCLKQ